MKPSKRKPIVSPKKLHAGRPTKFTPLLQEAICKCIRMGMGQDESANVNDLDRETLREWIKKFPSFSLALLKAKDQFEMDHLDVIVKAATAHRDANGLTVKGSWQAAAWMLERRLHQKYAQRWAGELTGKGGLPLIPEDESMKADLSKLSYDDLKRLVASTEAVIKGATVATKSDTNGNGHTNGNGNGVS